MSFLYDTLSINYIILVCFLRDYENIKQILANKFNNNVEIANTAQFLQEYFKYVLLKLIKNLNLGYLLTKSYLFIK